jgi:hypothetical protein
MAVPLDPRATVVIAAIVAVLALASGFGAWSVRSGSTSGPCQSYYTGRLYCTQTLTTHGWCREPAPCPNLGNSTFLLGYTFTAFPLIDPNGTPGLSLSVLGPGGFGIGVLLLTHSFAAPVEWTSSDGLVLVIWPNPPPSWERPLPESTSVICGVAGP